MKLVSWLCEVFGMRKTEARKVVKDLDNKMGPGQRAASIDVEEASVKVYRDRSGRLRLGEGENRRLRDSGELPLPSGD